MEAIYGEARLNPPEGRPVRSPHFSTRPRDLLGGRRPGEVNLAHHRVLLLDDLTTFKRRHLRVLREAIEADRARATREGLTLERRARFQLIATARSSPCGHRGDTRRTCSLLAVRGRSLLEAGRGTSPRPRPHSRRGPSDRPSRGSVSGRHGPRRRLRSRQARVRSGEREPRTLVTSCHVPVALDTCEGGQKRRRRRGRR